MRHLLAAALVALLGACAAIAPRIDGAASIVRTIDDLAAVAPALQESSERTLLVLDIDDTLLTSTGFFGSYAGSFDGTTLSMNGTDYAGDFFSSSRFDFTVVAQVATVPEPGTLALLLAAGVGAWLMRRRRELAH